MDTIKGALFISAHLSTNAIHRGLRTTGRNTRKHDRKHVRKHEARLHRIKTSTTKKFRLDSNDFGFILASVSNVDVVINQTANII